MDYELGDKDAGRAMNIVTEAARFAQLINHGLYSLARHMHERAKEDSELRERYGIIARVKRAAMVQARMEVPSELDILTSPPEY